VPDVGGTDVFEQHYMAQLEASLAAHGSIINYKRDRAALDVGLHLYGPRSDGTRSVSDVRVWFQAKGIQASTLARIDFEKLAEVPVPNLKVEHVRYWYAAPEPVYLAVFIEALDRFLAEDVRDIVDRSGGIEKLNQLAAAGQGTITLRVASDASLEEALMRMPRHRSLRIDGPPFRGRPLGHRYDPLRSELAPLAPDHFEELIDRLLDAHQFRETGEVELDDRFGANIGRVLARTGRLYLTYEWTSPLFSEFGFDPGSDFRIESQPLHAHGDVLVVVHAEPTVAPRRTRASLDVVRRLRDDGIDKALVFFNASEMKNPGLFGGWRVALDQMTGVPQGLGSLAFNVLTTTLVYLDFLDRLQWTFVNYL
jgi:hypothetical protein